MRHILFASDFSKASRKAFDTAVTTAKRTHAGLSIVHVVKPFVPYPDQYLDQETWETIDKQSHEWAQRHLDTLAAKATRAGVRANVVLADGAPAQEIPRLARRLHSDLLVMGTHGRTGLAKAFLGSVASQVIATATCPVMTVRGPR